MLRSFRYGFSTISTLLILILITFFAHATSEPMKFRHYSLDQGLSQGTILAMLQDSHGYLWFGTQDGLNRFDGYQFSVFRHDDEDQFSLSSDYITSLFEDQAGNLWIGTENGLNRFNRQTEQFSHFALGKETREGYTSQKISQITQTKAGQLWIGTHGGLYHFKIANQTNQVFKHDPNDPYSISSDAIHSLYVDDKKHLWIGTNKGLDSFSLASSLFIHWLTLPNNVRLSGNNISSIKADHQGNLWLGSHSSGLIHLTPSTGKIKYYRHNSDQNKSLAHDRVRSLLIDKGQNLWVGTHTGLSIYNSLHDNFDNYHNDPNVNSSLNNNSIWSLLEDDNDSVWLGSGDGINQFVQSTRLFGHRQKTSIAGEGINNKRVRSLFKTQHGDVWIGTDNGLNHYDPQTRHYQHFIHDPKNPGSISHSMIMSILVDSKDRLWVGSYDGGLNLMQADGSFQHFIHDPTNINSLSHNRVYSIKEDHQGILWLGTLNGLNRFDPQSQQFQHFYHQPGDSLSLSHSEIYTTLHQDNGDIWVATRNGGLNRFNPSLGYIQHYLHNPTNPKSLSHNRVFALYQQDDQHLWVATRNGLNLLDIATGKFTRYGKKQGLLNDTIYAVTGDDFGYIWVSTNRGLARFDNVLKRFKHYTKFNGLQSNEFNNGAYFKAQDGELFFGGINGFNRFYPDEIQNNLSPPKIEISQFYLANKKVGLAPQYPDSPLTKVINATEHIQLDHLDSVFSFEFTALHFINPDKNQFAYILDGFDRQWTHTHAAHRRATYTNLPAGHYRFKVKAANSDGIWNEAYKQVRITILPAPWRTGWAYFSYMFIFIATISAFAFMHLQKQRAIRESENRLSLSLWGSGNEFWDWDMKHQRIVRSNHSVDFTLPSGSHFSIDSLRALVHPDDFATLQKTFIAHKEGSTTYFEQAYRIRGLKNQWIWVLDRGQIVSRDERGYPLRALGTVQNIDKIKTIENQLRELNEQLEQRVASRTEELRDTVSHLSDTIKELTITQEQLVEAKKAAALNHLVTGIAHELNTPLGICITAASTLSEVSDNFFDLQSNNKLSKNEFGRYKHTCNSSITLITKNLFKTAEMVKTFKLVSVQSNGDELATCELYPLFKCVVNTFVTRLNQKQVKLTIKGDKDISLLSYGNSLDLVLTHLLNNSLLHGFNQAANNQITITLKANSQDVQIHYRDNGQGLNNINQTQIFEPFYTTCRAQGHLGLGMHIVFNHITQRLNGHIEIDNTTTQGLGYMITLPFIDRNYS